MPLHRSVDCECPKCLEDIHHESDWILHCNKNSNDSLCSRSRKKYASSFTQHFPSQCCCTQLHCDTKEDDVAYFPSEEESPSMSSQINHPRLTSEDISEKRKPLRELTIQELLREFGDSKKFLPSSISLGHFKDQVVMKFRRALYYSGIWVSHVQGYRVEKHYSAHYFKRNPHSLHRLIPWLKRELTAVYGDYGYTVKKIVTTILQHMTEYDLDSESFINLLEPYLLQHTHHFLHEFISFVHSPYNVESYDQRAIYCCSSPSLSVKKKSIASASDLPLAEGHARFASHHDTRPSKNTQGKGNTGGRPLSVSKPFPNGNGSSVAKKAEVQLANHKTESKTPAWIKEQPESGDHKSTLSTHSVLNWAAARERGIGSMNSLMQPVQERNIEGMTLFSGHAQNLGKSETIAHTWSTPLIYNQGQPGKCSLRERKVLNPDQQMNFLKKEVEKTKYSDASPKICQRRLPRGRSLTAFNARKRDPSWSCVSETALSTKRESRKLSSFRKKRLKCKPSRCKEIGSHSSRPVKRRSRSTTQRSKSCYSGYRKRSISRGSSNTSLRGGYRGKYFAQNVRYEPMKEKTACDDELNPRWASSAGIQSLKLSTNNEKLKCLSAGEDSSYEGSCNNLRYLQSERRRSPSEQKIKHRTTFPRSRRNRAAGHQNPKYQCPDKQGTEEVSSEAWDEDDIKEMNSPEYLPSCKRQIQQKEDSLNLWKCHRSKSKCRDKLETQKCKLF